MVTVKWNDGMEEYFGRAGQPFNGLLDGHREPVPRRGDGKDQRWDDKDEPAIQIATEDAKRCIAEQQAGRARHDE
jgi:hypothetical protein